MIKLLSLLPNYISESSYGDAGSYWINNYGSLLKVNNHYEYAVEWLDSHKHISLPYDDTENTQSKNYSIAFNLMFNSGWLRVSIDNSSNSIIVSNSSNLNYKQLSTLKNLAISLNYSIADDKSNKIIFSPSDTL